LFCLQAGHPRRYREIGGGDAIRKPDAIFHITVLRQGSLSESCWRLSFVGPAWKILPAQGISLFASFGAKFKQAPFVSAFQWRIAAESKRCRSDWYFTKGPMLCLHGYARRF
jgi:hypothetical protein